MKAKSINLSLILKILIIITSIVLFNILQGCSLFTKQVEKTESKEYTINTSGKESISLDNLNGKITIKRSSSDSVAVLKVRTKYSVPKNKQNEKEETLRINIDSVSKNLKIEIEQDRNFHFSFFNIDFDNHTSIELTIPDKLKFKVETVNGDINISDVNNDIEIETTNGDIKLLNLTGKIKSESVNGDIMLKSDSINVVDITSTNGNITIKASKKLMGNFNFESTNGKIKIDDRFNPSYEIKENKILKGKIGSSENYYKAKSTNGRIKLELSE